MIKSISERIKNEAIVQKRGFLGMLSGTSGVSLLGNLLTGTGTVTPGKGMIRASQDFNNFSFLNKY